MFDRLVKPSNQSSFFLFGARGTGKSTYLRQQWIGRDAQELWIDLLNPKLEDRLSRDPTELSRMITSAKEAMVEANSSFWVVIDEVQKVPRLLDVVHSEIENKNALFALTGSSARKLRRGAANLLAGRAFVYHLYPLTSLELGSAFALDDVLNWGTLPKIFELSGQDRAEYLDSYAHTYLKEEIIAEQLIRKVPPFRAFLEVAAQCSGRIVNYSKIARDIQSDPVSVESYFQILEDTLLGFYLRPFHESIRKRQKKGPKFYFFDLGVKRALERTLEIPVRRQTYSYGSHFEHFIIGEIIRLASYRRYRWDFSYLRTKDDAEIDLIIDRPGMPKAAVEIKSTDRIQRADLETFIQLSRDLGNAQSFCISQDSTEQKIEHAHCLPWQKALQELGLTDLAIPESLPERPRQGQEPR